MPRPIRRTTAFRPGARTVALSAILSAALVIAGCAAPEQEPEPTPEPTPHSTDASATTSQSPTTETSPEAETLTQQGVSAGHPLSAQIGADVLADGGNAVDAAIAVAFAQSVVEPVTSGIGGGGSVIVAGQDMDPAFHDYREVVNNSGAIPASNTGIPGFVAGMGDLHETYGELEWERLLRPAADLAAEGFAIGDYLANRMSTAQGILQAYPEFAPGGQVLGAGDWLVQPELSETIHRLADAGWEDFYTGEQAQSLSAQADGVDAESLRDYGVVDSEPVAGPLGDHVLASSAPPLPGVALLDMMNDTEAQGIAEMDPHSADYVETLSSAWQDAEQTIFTELGDPAFVEPPAEAPAEEVPAAGAGADNTANTTHISIVDQDGMTISMTNTILNFWGSGQMVDGYFLNNHLFRFQSIPSEANSPAPGKRPVTWSNPSMIFDGDTEADHYGELGRPILPVGSPGGPQILNIEGTVIAQWALQDRPLEEALVAPRFRASGNSLYVEENMPPEVIAELRNRGWAVEVWPNEQDPFGSVQALEINYDDGTITGADDPRRDGAHVILDH